MVLTCRFYENRYPEIEDVVVVNVRSIAEMGAYVHLLEYNNIEGMILLSELSRRRIRSINKLIRVGRNECVVVIRVDKDKGYIDLSKRRVSPEEVIKCEEKFAKAKAVNSILRHVGELLGYKNDDQLEALYKKTAWYFDEKYKRPGAAYEAFKHAVTIVGLNRVLDGSRKALEYSRIFDLYEVFENIVHVMSNPETLDECGLDEETKENLIQNIKRRLTPQSVKIRADIEVACTNYEGVDAVKRALKKGLEHSTENMPIKINLIAPPLYVVTTQTLERTEGLAALNTALGSIKTCIEQAGGMFNIQQQSRVVSDIDEQELAKQLQQLEDENREVSGDEDEEEDGGEEGEKAESGDDESVVVIEP